MKGRFDRRAGARSAMVCVLKLAVLFAVMLSMCAYALHTFSRSVGADADIGGLAAASAVYVVPVLVLPVMSFFAGGFAPGDRMRLVLRLAVCAYMLAFILLLSGGLSYAPEGIVLDSVTGATARETSLAVSPDGLMAVLALVPLFSAADAILEHLEPSSAPFR